MIAVLGWLLGQNLVIIPWFIVAVLTAVVDARLSRMLFDRPDSRRLAVWTIVSRIASSASFASICLILATDPARGSLACALLVGCAGSLNNAVMSRGSRLFTLTLVGPSGAILIATPYAASFAQPYASHMPLLLTIGVLAYLLFIGRLAEMLHREAKVLHDALDAAESANRAKSAFLATVSHEIRTPLNGVLGMAQAMQQDKLSEPQRGRLEVISQSGETLLAILNDVLDLSKIESGKLELEIADFDLEDVALGARAAFSALADRKGVSFDLVVEPGAKGVWRGDAVRVRQILYNLISNAVKFTDAGEVKARIDASLDGVRIAITDTGVGIADDQVDGLFQKFVQADSSITRRFGGTGLGLAICKELCTAMGGRISVTSRLGEGSCFTAELPLIRVATEARKAEPDVAVNAPAETGGSLRVLAAEDNAVNQLVLRTLLAQIGVEPTIVNNGAEALAAWETGEWDLILMDVQMPVMDGPAAAAAIRARETAIGRTPTPIVALTANAMSHQVETYRAAGMTGFLAKPIEVEALYKTLRSAADGTLTGQQAAA